MRGCLCKTVIAGAVVMGSDLHAVAGERWLATSSTAIAVTGNIEIDADTLIFGNGLAAPHADR